MRKITVYIQGTHKTVDLDDPLLTTVNSTLMLKNVAVYWFYKNLNETVSVKHGKKKYAFTKGYWSFDTIKARLEKEGILLQRNVHDNTCRIQASKDDANLGDIGPLLGFSKGQIIRQDTWVTSSNPVNVNNGLRYITINCDVVNSHQNTDTDGKRSYTLATLPITSEQNLNSSVTYYKDIVSKVVINDGYYNKLHFSVSSNIDQHVSVDLLLELYVV